MEGSKPAYFYLIKSGLFTMTKKLKIKKSKLVISKNKRDGLKKFSQKLNCIRDSNSKQVQIC